MWVYRHKEGFGYQIGFYEPDPPQSTPPHFVEVDLLPSLLDAQKMVNYLNGGTGAPQWTAIVGDDGKDRE